MTTAWTRLRDRGVVREDFPLGPLTTYKVGGAARWYVDLESIEDLDFVSDALATDPIPVLIIGQGSNLVVADRGFDGVAIHLGRDHRNMEVDGLVLVADGGVSLPRMARFVLDHGQSGLEFAVGIPGSVGGAIHQNAGCFGVETVDRLIAAEIVDLATGVRRWWDAAELDMSYRHTSVKSTDLVVSSRWRLTSGGVDQGRATIREITRWRRDHQPGGSHNAGSVFKNPPGGESAGALIDRVGLKGFSVGGASVSEKHANFFVASRDATTDEIFRLVEAIARRVEDETGIRLEREIEFVGRDQW